VEKTPANWRILARFIPIFRPYRHWLGLVWIGGLASAAMRLVSPYLLQRLTDAAFEGQRAVFIQGITLAGIVVAAGFGVHILYETALARFHTQVVRDLRLRLTAHIQRLPVVFLDSTHTGDLNARLNTDLKRAADLLRYTANNLSQPVLFILAFAYCLAISWKLLLVSCLLIPLTAVISNRINKPVEQLARQQAERQGEASALIQDMISGLHLVKAFNLQEVLTQKYRSVAREVEQQGVRIGRIQARMFGLFLALRYIPQLVVPLYGGYLAYQGEISIGSVLAFNMLVWSVFLPIETLLDWLRQVRETTPSGERIFQILDHPSEHTNRQPFIPGQSAPPVVFESVCFQYDSTNGAGSGETENQHPSRRLVLNNLSFQIPAGKTVALVGPSGCGKSTVIKLICGFYLPQSGQIRLMGQDLARADLAQVRAQLALVSQDTYLFPGTIGENIAYGKPSASQEEIVEAAQAANIHDFIAAQPQGYSTDVGERGIKLSGGQRQRIAIARAILKDAPVLLLDEPTSALDTAAEALVQESLERVMKGRTTLVVAHRLSTIRSASHILVMNAGEVVEQGDHAALMQTDSLYRRLYLKQAAPDEHPERQTLAEESGNAAKNP
jgi:ABC-type multidrug transport system fused ATPase/permease subunit